MDSTLDGVRLAAKDVPFIDSNIGWADDLGLHPLTLDEARKCCAEAAPDQILRTALTFEIGLPSKMELFQLIGEQWHRLPKLWVHTDQLRLLLKSATEEHLLAMMTPEEQAMRAELPDEFDVYRGCYHPNSQGLTWSQESAVAATFPYAREFYLEAPPLLVAARLRRRQSVVKIEATGATLVGWKPMIQSVQLLQPHSF